MKYSVILPCKDEEDTIGICIKKAFKTLGKNAEVIVIDNNSHDKSAKIALSQGAIVIKEQVQGYGAALLAGFNAAKGEYIIMCDADATYDLEEIPKLLKHKSCDIVIGNRFNRQMRKGAMTFMHKYIGNPLLSFTLRTFFKTKTKDTHSGFRLIKKSALERLKLTSKGMEIASEMLLKAAKLRMKVKEVPISYHKRRGQSKMNSFSDGWKHLRLMLLYSPNYLYLIPGFTSLIIGLAIMISLLLGPLKIGAFQFTLHPMFIGSLFAIFGYQIILLWLFSRIYMKTYFDDNDKKIRNILKVLTLEKGLLLGTIIFIVGLIININTLVIWIRSSFGPLYDIKTSIFGLTLILIGLQTIFSSFYMSILGMKNE
jgi:glycosyltransferase involved in cell wall biosynthesis